MKTSQETVKSKITLLLVLVSVFHNYLNAQSSTVTFTTPGATTWTVPPCVYQITVEVWGGGGGGGAVWSKFLNGCSNTSCQSAELCTAGGGGGGGGYATRTYSVQPGQIYNIVVGVGGNGGVLNASGTNRANSGSTGGASTFSGAATAAFGVLTANGGSGGGSANFYETSSTSSMFGHQGANGAGGNGGTGSNGSTNRIGGNGATGAHSSNSPDRSGGGGGGAGTTQNGSNANVNTGGTGGATGGGTGANGGVIDNYVGAQFAGGSGGTIIGGGGSGALIHNRVTQNNSSITTTDRQRVGGNGARGEVRITYNTSPSPSLGSGFVNGEWAFHGTVDGSGNVTNVDWEQGVNWRVWDQTQSQFILPASGSHPTTTSDVRLKSGTCLAQPTVNSINVTSTDNTNGTGAATCRNIVIESTGTLTINSNANVEHFHILGDYSNSGTVNYNNGRFKFVKTGTQTIYDASGTATFWEMNIGGSSLTDLNSAVTILNALRINGVVKTDGYLYWLNTTSIDGASTGVVDNAYGGHVFGTFRRTIQNNNATYRFPVGVGISLNTDRRLLEYINNGVVGPSHLDCSVSNTFKGSGNNIDLMLDPTKATEWGQFLDFVHPAAEWTLTPGAAFTSGSYGVRLYVQNFPSIDASLDNKFAILKRPTNSTTFFEFDAFDNSTSIPNGGLPGRVWNSGNGYAEKSGFTQLSKFVIASASLPLSVELEAYKVMCQSEAVSLNWTTASESSNDYFTIERADENLNYSVIGTLNAAGTSSIQNQYSFVDDQPVRGEAYYRLSQTDFDGATAILGVLSSTYPCDGELENLHVYPVPSSGELNVVFSHGNRQGYNVEVYNSIGQLVLPLEEGMTGESGSTLIKLEGKDLSSGVYLLKVKVGEEVFSEKVIIQH
jgi:hypothetical protein